MTEIETLTVTFEDLKANLDHFEKIAALGPWLPGKARWMNTHWHELLNEMYLEPLDPDEPELGLRALEETRGYRPFATLIRQR
jgi:hypothetical protein